MKKIDYFGEFIEGNKGLLAAIGIFAALTKYFFFTSPTDDYTKLILEENLLPGVTFLIFVFLSILFVIKIYRDKRFRKNEYLFIFWVLFSLFTLIVIKYFITFYKNWIEVGFLLILFFAVLIPLLNICFRYIIDKKNKGWVNLVHILIGLVIFYCLNLIQPIITNKYILFGIFAPIYIIVSVTILLLILDYVHQILKIIKRDIL